METPEIVDRLLRLAGDGEPRARQLYRIFAQAAEKEAVGNQTPPFAVAVAMLLAAVDLLTDPAVANDAVATSTMTAFSDALPVLRENRPAKLTN